ncbi:MAG TPA: energy transducer TonB [bacterium]|nr:energy transducer TonB [bacterium]
MNSAFERPSDRWVSRGVSLCLHALLFLACWAALRGPAQPSMVIFSVETVSGIMPRGEGSGASGSASQISNQESSDSNPLAGGLRLSSTDAPVPAAPHEADAAKAAAKPRTVQAPSLSDVDKLYQKLQIGVQPREPGASDQPSEGGMGNAHQAGTENGALGLSGAIAGRGYRIGDYSYGKPLPEESEVVVLLTVDPKGEVLQAEIKKTSGYPDLDQHALTASRDIVFDALPPDVPQENKTGTVTFSYDYSGRAK